MPSGGNVLLLLAVLATSGLAMGAVSARRDPPPFLGQTETWDYGPAMREVAQRFTGTEGVVLHLGDSITFASPYAAWAQRGRGKTAEDEAILRWSHCGEANDLDGWYLATQEVGEYWSYTAAGGVRADQFLAGGYGGLLPAADIIRRYNPQVAVVMLGTNDAWSGTPAPQYITSMKAIVHLLRGWLSVRKLEEVRARVWGEAPQGGREAR